MVRNGQLISREGFCASQSGNSGERDAQVAQWGFEPKTRRDKVLRATRPFILFLPEASGLRFRLRSCRAGRERMWATHQGSAELDGESLAGRAAHEQGLCSFRQETSNLPGERPTGKSIDYNKQMEQGLQERYINFFLLVKLLFFQATLSDKRIFDSCRGSSENVQNQKPTSGSTRSRAVSVPECCRRFRELRRWRTAARIMFTFEFHVLERESGPSPGRQ